MKVPWMPKKEISSHASNLLAGYQEVIRQPVKPPIPVEDIIERYIGLSLSFEDLEEKLGMKDVLGATYVTSRRISINERLFEDKSEGRLVYTCAHEVGHWVLHRKFVEVAERSGSYKNGIVCRSVNSKKPIEWQADYFAACLLMPEKEVENAFRKVWSEGTLVLENIKSSFGGRGIWFDPCVENWHLIASLMCEVGGFTNVSKQAMIIRLEELGLLVNLTGESMGWKKSASAS